MLLSKAWDCYEADKRIEGFSPQTLRAYKLQTDLLIRHFGDVKIDSLSTEQIKEYLAILSKNIKPSSLAHRIRYTIFMITVKFPMNILQSYHT
ncbi:site-specific integrase [Calidifontibacillus oryziterrae]|uniref:phage integrase N-terminal SAM-like domain-containing protein n=1 Tax=Calidifontibacillus oryziterrae TaxID=1191699 RepID=UPI00035DBAFF|nr:phage integrase N-terminal SAM-like domain-containing protein [Calidifontibacillus oryziterrae]